MIDYTDQAGTPLAIGTRVRIKACPHQPEFVGAVIDHDDGDTEAWPAVVVLFDDGHEDAFDARQDADDQGPFGPRITPTLVAIGVTTHDAEEATRV